MSQVVLIGIGAGAVSAALYASAWTGTVLGMFVLFFLSPMPVAIGGLGWGWVGGTIASAAGTLAVGLAGGHRSGLVYLLSLAAPAAMLSYFALLNRQAEDGSLEWYPIGRILAWGSLWAGLLAAAAILVIGTDTTTIRNELQQVLDRMLVLDGTGPGGTGPGGTKMTPEQVRGFAALMTILLPWAIATTWFAVAILNVWGAAHVVRHSGRLSRPWPDLSAITLPPGLPLAFGVAAVGTTMGDMVGLISSGFASALVFAFMLVGLGILHRLTRGTAVRPLLLGMVYAGLLMLSPFSSLVVAMIGLAEPFLRRRLPPSPPPPS